MKKLFLGSLALAAMVAGPAVAADMPVRVRAAPVVAYYDWSGVYGGFSAGYMWTRTDRNYPYFGPVLVNLPESRPPEAGGLGNHQLSTDDGVWDAHIGVQWQTFNWVWGVEASITGCFNECVSTVALGPPIFERSNFSQTKLTNLFTVGPRIGYAWDRWMLYATGGAAATTLKDTNCSIETGQCNPATLSPGAVNRASGATLNFGYFVGGGLEAMIHKGALVDVILGVEYIHFETNTKDAICRNPGCAPHSGGDDTLSARGDKVTARISIKTQAWNFWN